MKTKYCRLSLLLLVLLAACAAPRRIEVSDVSISAAAAPESDQTSGSLLPTGRSIAIMERRIAENSRDYISTAILGELYLRRARETGDLSYIMKAEATYRRALEIKPDYTGASAGLAGALASQHRFIEAREIAARTIAKDPSRLDALSTLFDSHFEVGNYADAASVLRELKKLTDSPAVMVREAHLAEIHGDNATAHRLIRKAANEIVSSGAPQEEIAWYFYRQGDIYDHTGDVKAAEKYYKRSLDAMENYGPALFSLAKLETSSGRVANAIPRLEALTSRAPSPQAYFALGNAYVTAGEKAKADAAFEKGENLWNKNEANRRIYGRELAKFYGERGINLDRALALIESDLKERPDIFGYDAYAVILYKLGRRDDSKKALQEAMKYGTKEAEFKRHAAYILEERGAA